MSTTKAKAPPCIQCLLGEPDSDTSTAMFMLLTAVRVEKPRRPR